MHRSTSSTRRACALGTTVALIGLTTGLGVFTSTAAFAVDEPTSAVAPADTSSTGTTGTSTAGTDTTATGTTGSAATPTDATTAPTTTGTSTDTAPAPSTGDTTTPAPAATSPAPSTTTKAAAAAAPTATSSATIVGAPKVGVTLFYKTTGIDDPRAVWTVEGGTPVTASSFDVTADMIGKTITLTVTGRRRADRDGDHRGRQRGRRVRDRDLVRVPAHDRDHRR